MAEYIDKADTLHHMICDIRPPFVVVESMPAADVAPVRHGKWIMTLNTTTSKRGRSISNKKFSCSGCGYSNGRKQSNYCPKCGAKMDGGSEDG